MKTFKMSFDEIIAEDNIRLAIKNATRGNKHNKNRCFKEAKINPDKYISKCIEYIKTFEPFKHREKQIYDGISHKKRTIIVPTFYEQVMHHAIIQIIKPAFMKGMYYHSYASIPGRGPHKGKKVIKKWLKDTKNTKYCLKIDIRKFFDSIDHDILKNKINKNFYDTKIYWTLCQIINTTNKGLPLGFYTSQWFANWYLQELDHYIKEQLHIMYYIRYMDDIVIFSSNKRKLHKIFPYISFYNIKNLRLCIKDNWQIFKFDNRPLDFMGFKFYYSKITLRKNILKKFYRKVIRIVKKEKPTIFELRQVMSYLGYLKATNIYNWYKNHIKDIFSFQYAKRRIAKFDRRLNHDRLAKVA